MRHKDELSAKVEAVNLANKTANEIYPILRKVFEPFMGQNITKNDGTLLARIVKLIPELPDSRAVTVYGKHSKHSYSVSFTVKTCVSYGEHSCTYYEIGVYICDVTNGVVTRFYDVDERKTDYTVEDILAKREAARAAKKAYEDARSACFPFDER